MSKAAFLIVIRQHRVELLSFGLLSAVIAIAAVWMAWQLGSLDLAECLVATPSPDCQARTLTANSILGFLPVLQAAGAAAPPLIGLFIGAPFLARELERGTAVFPWTFGPSRTRWLIQRLLILGASTALFSLLIGLAIDAVYATSYPQLTLDRLLVDYQVRGPLLAARGLLAFVVATLVGASLARLLPSLLVGAAAVAMLVGATVLGIGALNRADPVEDPGLGGVRVEFRYRDRDGTLFTEEEASDFAMSGEEFRERFETVDVGIPGDRSAFLAIREIGVCLIATGVATVAVLWVVRHRRPY